MPVPSPIALPSVPAGEGVVAAMFTFFTRGGGLGREGRAPFRFARERIHEVEGVYLIPVVFTGFGLIYTGFEPDRV
jgi:hypothetical protein